ncbi:MAG TPA: uroporphyrinogen-III synthase [Candidatus Acidoferrum sp.]|nr:uroporphyrinogen-III synthase [Candidatus Acidoferrum sp.]
MDERFPSALAGKRVVITRAAAQSEALARELSGRGAIPVVVPLVSFAEPEDFAPLDAAIMGINEFDWMIFTSAQAVRAVTKRWDDQEFSGVRPRPWSKLRVACVGPVSAEAVRQTGLPVAYVAETHNGAALAEELRGELDGARVFLPRSDRANPDLPVALKRHGAQVTEVIAYRTLRPTALDEEKLTQIAQGAADAVLFFSPSAVHHFAELRGAEQLRQLQDKLAITAVGAVTAKALREEGVVRAVIAADTTAASVIEALEKHFADGQKAAPSGVRRG